MTVWLQFIVLVQGAALIGLAAWVAYRLHRLRVSLRMAHDDIREARSKIMDLRCTVRTLKVQEVDKGLGF